MSRVLKCKNKMEKEIRELLLGGRSIQKGGQIWELNYERLQKSDVLINKWSKWYAVKDKFVKLSSEIK